MAKMRIVGLEPEHVPGAMRLKEAAGWNQLPQDWLGYLELAPSGCFGGMIGDRLVATGTAISYGRRVGWIGMILVDPEFRRQGLATRIMSRLIDHLDGLGCATLKLDATEAGAAVYAKLGFHVEYQVERWVRPAQPLTDRADSSVRSIDQAVLPRLADWDRTSFGVDRAPLLEWFRVHGGPAEYIGEPAKPEAFILGRPGSGAHQIGPLTAGSADAAAILLRRAVARCADRPLIADLISHHNESRALLEGLGFRPSRLLQRMYRGPNSDAGRPESLYCLAGFEFG